MHSIAIPTDIADSSLKDCDRRGRGLIDGWALPFRAAYSGIVEDVVNANAMVAAKTLVATLNKGMKIARTCSLP